MAWTLQQPEGLWRRQWQVLVCASAQQHVWTDSSTHTLLVRYKRILRPAVDKQARAALALWPGAQYKVHNNVEKAQRLKCLQTQPTVAGVLAHRASASCPGRGIGSLPTDFSL